MCFRLNCVLLNIVFGLTGISGAAVYKTVTFIIAAWVCLIAPRLSNSSSFMVFCVSNFGPYLCCRKPQVYRSMGRRQRMCQCCWTSWFVTVQRRQLPSVSVTAGEYTTVTIMRTSAFSVTIIQVVCLPCFNFIDK